MPDANEITPGHQFYSDNCSGVCPEAWEALEKANRDYAAPYGTDDWTRRAQDKFCEVFETDCAVFFFTTGTSANAAAMAHLCRSYHSIVCSHTAHVAIGECGAPGYYSGGAKLLPVDSPTGKLTPEAVRSVATARTDIEFTPCRLLTLTQSTEYGTVYTAQETHALAEVARRCNMRLHIDGARWANALAHLGQTPKSMSWELGVDVLSLGGTKNGMAAGEAVIIFDPDVAEEFDYRQKHSGQLSSKMRFQSAVWLAMLENETWLKYAAHANECARRLCDRLCELPNIQRLFPVEANAMYLQIPPAQIAALAASGWGLVTHIRDDAIRLMCSWRTTDAEIAAFVRDARATVHTA